MFNKRLSLLWSCSADFLVLVSVVVVRISGGGTQQARLLNRVRLGGPEPGGTQARQLAKTSRFSLQRHFDFASVLLSWKSTIIKI